MVTKPEGTARFSMVVEAWDASAATAAQDSKEAKQLRAKRCILASANRTTDRYGTERCPSLIS